MKRKYSLGNKFSGSVYRFGMFFKYLVVQCEWSTWVDERCSRSCGGGLLSRIRIKTQEEVGTECKGDAKVVKECNKMKCPSMLSFFLTLMVIKMSSKNLNQHVSLYK